MIEIAAREKAIAFELVMVPFDPARGYEPKHPGLTDLRSTINPKKEYPFEQKPYFQVFEERHGFVKNLSTVDLLFNQGPQSLNYL